MNALPGDEAVSLQTVGIYAFTLNRTAKKGGFVYINDYQKAAVTLQKAIQHLAPQYGPSSVNIVPILARIGH